MTRNLLVCAALAAAWLGSIATTGMAQDPILAELYGSGVHEYFSGGYRKAIDDLTEAVDGGTKDPRVYYFRALSWWRLGDTSKAKTDLAAGAKMESADVNQYYPVSKSLERVQGTGRLMLERYRVQARAETYRREERRNLARYEAQRKAEAEVLRATPVPPAPSDAAAAAAPVAKPAEKPPAEMPATPAEEPDPFADDPDTKNAPDEMSDKDAESDKDADSDKDAAPADENAADADAADAADEMPAEDSADGEMKDDADAKDKDSAK
ncbi:MAG TPA: hypothetical protein VHY91_27615 [Pirellulales bacterium]|jgi:hypothetical protein|nr:hypothetical protein [Pirellulales bacterium]